MNESPTAPKAIGIFDRNSGISLGFSDHFRLRRVYVSESWSERIFQRNPGYFPADLDVIRFKPGMAAETPQETIDLIYTAPPCSPWSRLGNRTSRDRKGLDWKEHPRAQELFEGLRLFDQMFPTPESLPKFWAFESLPSIAPQILEGLDEKFTGLGYCVVHLYLDTVQFKVPQTRPRFWYIAHRVELNWNAWLETVGRWFGYIKTTREALSEVVIKADPPYMRDIISEILAITPPGKKLRTVFGCAIGERKLSVPGPAFGFYRLSWDRPMITTTRSSRLFHPDEHRPLTIPEACVMQGFPQDYRPFSDERNAVYRFSVGVLPPVASAIGLLLHQAWVNNKPIETPQVIEKDLRPLAGRAPTPITPMPKSIWNSHPEWKYAFKDIRGKWAKLEQEEEEEEEENEEDDA